MAKGSKPADVGKALAKIVPGKSDSGGKARQVPPFRASASKQSRALEAAERSRVRQAKQQGKK